MTFSLRATNDNPSLFGNFRSLYKQGRLARAPQFALGVKVMVLDCPTAEALSQLAADRGWDAVADLACSSGTLAGLLELGRTAIAAGQNGEAAMRRLLAGRPSALQVFTAAHEMWHGRFDPKRASDHLFSAPEFELWLVRTAACVASNEFSLFANRFQRRLKACGFGDRFPYALSQALTEMTENVVRHSAPRHAPPALGLVAYHVIDDEMNYYVGDLGRGVLRSLHENPRWLKLATEGDALVAAAKDGASRSVEQTEGDGFRLAFKGFMDRAGVFAMRSGDGAALFRGNLDGREVEVGNAAHVAGLRVAACCSLKGASRELPFHC